MSIKDNINLIIGSVSYVNQFHGNTFLIKLGGSILHDDKLIETLCSDLKLLIDAGIKLVIVHGGSKAINENLAINQVKSEFIDGLRVTSPEAMKIIEMVLCGHVNNVLVRKLNSIGINAIGLSGADNSLLQCDYYSEHHGCVGNIKSVNSALISHLFAENDTDFNTIPVISPIGVDDKGNALNINADYAASYLASALQVDKLIYLTDQDGIYNDKGEIYSELTDGELQALIDDGIVYGGMLTKTNAIMSALSSGLNHIHILNGSVPHILLQDIFTQDGAGTLCKHSISTATLKESTT